MAGRQTRGRQRIPIRLIENQDDLYATFSKRRLGLYKKASEFSTTCGVDIGIIIFSPSNNPFSFFSPSMDSVLNRCMNPNQEPSGFVRMLENVSRTRIQNFGRRLDEVQERKEGIRQRERYLDEIDRTRQRGWWEQAPIESLNEEQVREWKARLESLRSRATNRIEELRNGGSSSSVFQQQTAPNFPYEPEANTSIGANIFSQNYFPFGATYASTSDIIFTGQFPGQYYAPPMFQHPSSGGVGTSYIPPQYHVPPQAHDPFPASSSASYFPSQYYYFPPQAQNPSASGRTGEGGPSNVDPFLASSSASHFPSQYYYFPPQAQNPSASGRTGEGGPSNVDPFLASSSTSHFPSQYYNFPSQAQNPSTGGRTGEGGPSNVDPFVASSSTSHFPSQYFPQQAQNPSAGGGTGEVGPSNVDPIVASSSTSYFPSQYYYFPSQAQNPSAGSRTRGDGPSNVDP